MQASLFRIFLVVFSFLGFVLGASSKSSSTLATSTSSRSGATTSSSSSTRVSHSGATLSSVSSTSSSHLKATTLSTSSTSSSRSKATTSSASSRSVTHSGSTISSVSTASSSHSKVTTSPVSITSSSHLNALSSCTATSTITASASTVTRTVTSSSLPSTCPTIRATNTITSVSTSISTTTVTITATALPSCFPHINGGDFTSSSQNLGAFTVTQNPAETIFNQVLASSAQEFVSVTDGTPQFLFLNYELLPIPTTFTLAQYIGDTCTPYTTLTVSATINAEFGDGVVTFCINPTTCSAPQSIPASNGHFVQYSASFPVTAGNAVTASVSIAVNDFAPQYFAGIGNFQVTPS